MQSSSDVVIIGAGVSGLTAAYLAARNRKSVTVVDPCEPGGVIRTVRRDGFTLECGPNVLLEKPEFSRLLDMLGMRAEMVYPATARYRQFVWHAGAMHAVPKSPLIFLRTALLSPAEKIEAVRALFAAGKWRRGEAGETVAQFFARAVGEGPVRRILDPALKGIYGGSIDRLSAAALFPGLWGWADGSGRLISYLRARRQARGRHARVFVLKNGMDSLIAALQEKSGDRLTIDSDRVVAIERCGKRFRSTTAAGRVIESAEVWSTLTGAAGASICGALMPELREPLAKQRYAALTVVHCAVSAEAPLPPRSFGVLFPTGTPDSLLGIMFNSNLFPHLAPRGRALLTVCLGGAEPEAEKVVGMNDAESGNLVIAALERYLGASGAEILGVQRWPRAIPQYEPGTAALDRLYDAAEQRVPGLHFAGADRGGVGVPDRVRCVFERVVA